MDKDTGRICTISGALFVLAVLIITPNVPSGDDFDSILKFLLDWDDTPNALARLKLLWAPHNEHHIVLLKVMALTLGADFSLIATLGGATLAAAGALLLASLRTAPVGQQSASRTERLTACFLLLLLAFSPRHWEVVYWATTAASALPAIFFSISTLFLLSRQSPCSSSDFYLALTAAFLASMSQTNGVLVFLAGGTCVFQNAAAEVRHRRLILWTVAGSVLLAALLSSGSNAAAMRYAPRFPSAPIEIGNYYIHAVGSLLPARFSGFCGVILIAATLWRFRSDKFRHSFLAAVVLFFHLTLAMVAVGRYQFPVDSASSSRYAIYSAFLAIALAWGWFPSETNERRRIVVLTILVIVVAGSYVSGIRELQGRLANLHQIALLIDLDDGGKAKTHGLFYPADRQARASQILQNSIERGLYGVTPVLVGHFSPKFAERTDGAVIEATGGHVDRIEVNGNEVSLAGWQPFPTASGPLCFLMPGRVPYMTLTFSPVRREDVVKALAREDLRMSGFEVRLRFNDAQAAQEFAASGSLAVCQAKECERLRR